MARGKSKPLKDVSKLTWNPRGSKIQRHWDSIQSGLFVQIYPAPADKRMTGRRVFYVRFTRNEKQSMKRMGDFPELSLDEARKRAAEIRVSADLGINQDLTMDQLFSIIMRNKTYPIHNRSFAYIKDVQWKWDKYVTFKNLLVKDITTKHWRELILSHRDAGRIGTTKNLIALCGTFYRNAQQHLDYGELRNPLSGIKFELPPAKEKALLTKEEIATFSLNSELHDAISKVLILTGQRISEILRMKWTDLEDGIWIVGRKGEMKNKSSAHHLPLTGGIWNAVKDLPRTSEYVFKGKFTHVRQASYYEYLKTRYPHLSAHCFRHTFATLASEAGIDPYGISLVLHHSHGDMTHKVYIHSQQIARKREVLEQWEKVISSFSK